MAFPWKVSKQARPDPGQAEEAHPLLAQPRGAFPPLGRVAARHLLGSQRHLDTPWAGQCCSRFQGTELGTEGICPGLEGAASRSLAPT